MADSIALSKRSRILEAARQLLIKRGFQDVILDDVAREAGVAKGTLFLHFKNKDELVSAAFADMMDQLGDSLDRLMASGKKGKSLFEETVRTVLAYLDRNQDFMSQFGAGRFPSCGERSCGMLMQKMSANKDRMVKILKLASPWMNLELANVDYAAVALFGLCRSALVHRAIAGDRKPLISRTAKVMGMFAYGAQGKR